MWKDLERSGEWKRREGKRGERKDPQEAILILKNFCTSQTPDRPPLAAILVINKLKLQTSEIRIK